MSEINESQCLIHSYYNSIIFPSNKKIQHTITYKYIITKNRHFQKIFENCLWRKTSTSNQDIYVNHIEKTTPKGIFELDGKY